MKLQRARIPSFLFADYVLKNPAGGDAPSRLFVLMHGYEQSGDRMFAKLESIFPSDAAILAPNGPFPLPRRTESGYRIGFSWYFYNPQTDEYYMDMEIGVDFVTKLIAELGFSGVPTTLIGFSQGGYLAPFVAQKMPQVDQVIGLACQFLVDEMDFPVSFRMDALHGAHDQVVPPESAQKQMERLRELGVRGEFQLLPETEHRIDASMLQALAGRIKGSD